MINGNNIFSRVYRCSNLTLEYRLRSISFALLSVMIAASSFHRGCFVRSAASSLPRHFPATTAVDQNVAPTRPRMIPNQQQGLNRRWYNKEKRFEFKHIFTSIPCTAKRNLSRKRQSFDTEEDTDVTDDSVKSTSLASQENSLDKSNNNATISRSSRAIRRTASGLISAIGFLSSTTTALLTDRGQIKGRWRPSVEALRRFLKTSGIDLEISQSLNMKLLDSVVILATIQKRLLGDRDPRDLVKLPSWQNPTIPTEEESFR